METQQFLRSVKVEGWFGRDLEGEYSEDQDTVLEYLHVPDDLNNVHFDLTLRHKDDEARQDGTTYEHILRWIMAHCKDEKGNPQLPEGQIVCKKNSLRRLMVPPGSRTYPTEVLVTRQHGVIYLKIVSLEDETRPCVAGEDVMNRMSRFGAKFEHYVLSSSPNKKPNPQRPITRYGDMQLVYRASLGGHRVLYAGEADGLPDKDALRDLNSAKLVELKCIGDYIDFNRMHWSKPVDWWTQCALGKCGRILMGWRDDDKGVVHRLEWLTLDGLVAKTKHRGWEPQKCVKYGIQKLDQIVAKVKSCGEGEVTRYKMMDQRLELIREERAGAMEELLPDFYQDWMKTAVEAEEARAG